uniref:TPR_REGION domain-containing protein n=1 Tax=Glossina brevipalpis TaxID=37001 RepID=A0A1A9X0Y8_9MUSC
MCLNVFYLCNFNDKVTEKEIENDHLKRIWRCEWSPIHLENSLQQSWESAHKSAPLTQEESDEFLLKAIELLLIFTQNNFTGPFDQLGEFKEFIKNAHFLNTDAATELKENGEELNPNVNLAELLLIARWIIKKLLENTEDSMIIHWWHLRCLCIHQHILDGLTSNLYKMIEREAEWLLTHVDEIKNKEYEALLLLEIANAYLQFHRCEKSQNVLETLCERLQIDLNVIGFLGVRTKFQQKSLPQLCLMVEQNNSENVPPPAVETNGDTELPKLLLLEDDTRLERIKFIDPKHNDIMTLPSILQALVLAKVRQLKRSTPKDRLADEQLEPYIQTLLYQKYGPLQVRQSALLLNCLQESNQRRTVERSWKQCEKAVMLLSNSAYTVKDRFSYAFASFLQPKWHIQLQLCDLLISLGMIKTALDIYLEIQAWEQVITCYTILELRHKAAEVIHRELQKKPTVLLHCLLGDATDDPTCYKTAWEFSELTSGKAQAHWGNYHFRRKEYEDAIPHYERSVKINSLQEKIWLRLGYAAIMLEKWELAVHAYITYTHLEPFGFESWNNLAKALIKLGDKQRAHKVLNESLKCNFNNWKVWENFLLVSVDTGNFEDAINAYNRLTELKVNFFDFEVLSVVITAIAEGKPDAKGQAPERLMKKAINLMGHQCIKHGSEAKIWELAAVLAQTPLKKADKLVKAFRAYTAKELLWSSKQPYALKALQICKQLSQHSLKAITDHASDESEVMITSQLSSARLADQACLRAIEKEAIQFPENLEELKEVNILLEKINENIKQRMSK